MKRAKFSLSHHKLLTCDQGKLVPCGLLEVLPGDSIQHATGALVRVTPMLAPMMHQVDIKIHHWFVPHRLVWDDWEDFITGGPDGDDDSIFPTYTPSAPVPKGGLLDYLGIPIGAAGQQPLSVLPIRGYNLIWNEWYRDQDLQTPVLVSKASGNDVTTTVGIRRVAWEKDYFTSARPWPQKGPEITLPLGTTAPVVSSNLEPTFSASDATWTNRGLLSGAGNLVGVQGGAVANKDLIFGNESGLIADLSDATAVSIIDVRQAFALQRFAEARARYGSRYTEYLRYLGVRSSDSRLQRPEYLGGGRQTLQISEVLQTGVTTDGDDSEGVGNLKGHGIGAMRTNRYRRFFEEHGYVFSLLYVRPRTMYVQGIPRTFNRRTKEDFFQKELQHIGQQEILNKELYAAHSQPNGVFGYQDRYDEYRRQESTVSGDFRDILDFWHMARIFTNEPALNSDFIESVPTDRVYADTNEDPLWIMLNHSIQARRLLSKTGSSSIM